MANVNFMNVTMPINSFLSSSYQAGSRRIMASEQQKVYWAEAQRIFRNYALSPADFSEAVVRFVRMSADSESLPEDRRPLTSDIVQRVLYSLECEDVWLRS
jgi:hypothetical protein